jgi:eukaryotic-like serine/threonine-protein kinase
MSVWVVPGDPEVWVVPGYTEQRELGHGASARVVAATRNDSGQQVAIKYLAPRLLRDPNLLARFREEVGLLASIDVPHVVRLFDYVEDPGQGAAIVMELVDGVSLHEMITRQGATSPESALVVLKGSLLGLAAAHQLGIVHRDYKPENVLVDGAGNSKLTDFGVAVKAGDRAPVGGTPLYMAPEQWNGEPATPATDIYAATAVFFECLTGQTPFSGQLGHLAMQHQTAAIPVALVDPPLQALIERGMAKDPRDRPAHAMEFVAELNRVADGAYGPDWEERGGNELAKRAAALLLLLLGGIAGAAGGSFAATLLGGMGRRKKAVIAGAAVGIFAAIAVTTTTLALTGNSSPTTNPPADASTRNPVTVGAPATGSPTAGPSATGSPTASPSGKASPTASPSGTGSPTASPSGKASPTASPSGKASPTASPSAASPTTNPPPAGPSPTNPPSTVPPAPPPVITAAADPAAVSGTCPAELPSLTVPGTISSDRATTVTYHWARSDQTSTGPTQVEIPAGGTVSVPDSVTAASNQWVISDTLVVTSPSAHSAGAMVSVQCAYPTLTMTNPGTQQPQIDVPFSLSLTPSGGGGPYSWSQTGTLPPGLSFGGGVITGIPTAEGRFIVTITVTDTEASPQTASVSFIIDPLGVT